MFGNIFKDRDDDWMGCFLAGLAIFVVVMFLFALVPFFMILDHHTKSDAIEVCKSSTDVTRCIDAVMESNDR